MDLDGEDLTEIKSAGDTQLMKIIPSKSDALSSGIIASFSMCGGKAIKALFNYLTEYQKFNFDFYKQGFQIDGIKMYENNTIDTLSYVIYKADKLLEYIFCPQNIPGCETRETISIKVSSKEIFSYLKKTKAQTSIRIELNRHTPKLILYVINGGTSKPFYIDYEFCMSTPCPISGDILKPDLVANYKTLIEVFSSEMASQSTKYGGTLYDFNLAVYREGIYVWSNAPGVGGVQYGKVEDTYLRFQLPVESAKRWSTLFKISPNATLSIFALDENIIKFYMPVTTSGEMYVFQFPKATNPMLTNLLAQRNAYPQMQMQMYPQVYPQMQMYQPVYPQTTSETTTDK